MKLTDEDLSELTLIKVKLIEFLTELIRLLD